MSESQFLLGLLFVLSASLIMSGIRILSGPTIADRGVAFDIFTSIAIGWIALAAKIYNSQSLLNIIFALTFLSFVGTLALVYLFEKTRKAQE